MRFRLLCLFAVLPLLAQEVPPLEDALWQGRLQIKVTGNTLSQTTANVIEELGGVNATPVGFLKAKGNVDIDLNLTLEFQVNELGEHSFRVVEAFKADRVLDKEYRYRTTEDHQVSNTNITTQRVVQVLNRTDLNVHYEREKTYANDEWSFGSIQIRPSGRMKKKGSMDIEGDLLIIIEGDGKEVHLEERQPPPEEHGAVRRTLEIKHRLELPLKFSFTVDHRKKPVNGGFNVIVPVENTFSHDEVDQARTHFQNRLKASGTYQLDPLF